MACKAPSWTPYRFCADNPILFVDRAGSFEIPIHKEIMEQSIKNSVAPITNGNARELIRGVRDADRLGFAFDLHFDGRATKQQIDDNWKAVSGKIHNSTSFYELGRNLHTVEDFYSHSNYVELYIAYFKKNGGDVSELKPGGIPLYENATDEFKTYLADNGLKTGEFHLGKWLLGKDNKGDGQHHDDIAKDSPESGNGATCVEGTNNQYSLHDYAKALATQATTNELNNNQVNSNNTPAAEEKSACEIETQ
jgi:CRISPR/Cas system-associated protein endoribonuclease Cas2